MYRFLRGVRHHLMLMHGRPLWSQVENGVSGLISRWGGELRLFLEVQQGCQTILCCDRNLGVPFKSLPWNQSLCQAEGEDDVLSTYSRDLGVLLEFPQVRQCSAYGVSGTSGFLSNRRMRIGPHLEMIWCTRSSLVLWQ